MSEAERQQAFLQGLAVLCKVHGMNITATISTEYLGDAVLSKPVLSVVPIAGWQPPVIKPEPAESDDPDRGTAISDEIVD
jgi:hypothetical protein